MHTPALILPQSKCVRALWALGAPWGAVGAPQGSRAGPGSPSHPTPARSRTARGTGAAPAPGIRPLPGDGKRLGQDIGLWVRVRIRPSEDNMGQTCPGCVGRAMGTQKVHTS